MLRACADTARRNFWANVSSGTTPTGRSRGAAAASTKPKPASGPKAASTEQTPASEPRRSSDPELSKVDSQRQVDPEQQQQQPKSLLGLLWDGAKSFFERR